ncbi:hypothetical protein [Dongshaea marina]|uniref:hypothetical protein n=1 Tax=Dongshaea marina TaxID=2047966 RepID=UPI00131ED82A|nr:hypothetical protein [Dongshaea marina]
MVTCIQAQAQVLWHQQSQGLCDRSQPAGSVVEDKGSFEYGALITACGAVW